MGGIKGECEFPGRFVCRVWASLKATRTTGLPLARSLSCLTFGGDLSLRSYCSLRTDSIKNCLDGWLQPILWWLLLLLRNLSQAMNLPTRGISTFEILCEHPPH